MKPGDLVVFKPEFNGPEFADKPAVVLREVSGRSELMVSSWVVFYNGKEYHVAEFEVVNVTEQNQKR